ncbi:unnamed protein product [Sphenostylis stenocarpa]|uniref:Uncharacterized protein n=1 Tax=Sphenostylis stenocarpa TaxID=92480 RepID=A0AA86RV30_9FABA|nr:unnamed protein product [Sphenostylis stenocarpa]
MASRKLWRWDLQVSDPHVFYDLFNLHICKASALIILVAVVLYAKPTKSVVWDMLRIYNDFVDAQERRSSNLNESEESDSMTYFTLTDSTCSFGLYWYDGLIATGTASLTKLGAAHLEE